MKKEIKDFIHLYLGCEWQWTQYSGELESGIYRTDLFNSQLLREVALNNGVAKPILRPLSDMTEEEWKDVFRLSVGAYKDAVVSDFKKLSTNQVSIKQGYAQYNISFNMCYDNDARIGNSVSFVMTKYKVKDVLSVGSSGMEETQSEFNEPELMVVMNQVLIFKYLLSKHFDLFNLIPEGLALDATKK